MLQPIGTITKEDLKTTSQDYKKMLPYWLKIRAIQGGVDTMREREDFLPQFPQESKKNYAARLSGSRFTDIFSDIHENLASKPFSKEVSVKTGGELVEDIIEDIDGAGNHLNVFASELFYNGIGNAIEWVLVDFPKMPEGATLAYERLSGARPYWSRVAADRMLMVETDKIGGKQTIVFAKMLEVTLTPKVVRKATVDVEVERVRIFKIPKDENGNYTTPIFEVWEYGVKRGAPAWELIDTGYITIGVIPLVPFYTGKKDDASYEIRPPLRNVADLQIEHYQQQTNLKASGIQIAFPMLQAVGVKLPVGEDGKPLPVPIGANGVLATPPPTEQGQSAGRWEILEMSGASLTFLSNEADKTEQAMREIGKSALVAGTAGITQVAAAFASQKSSSAVQVWAYLLKDCLEQCMKLTAMWRNSNIEPEISVHTDFAIELGDSKSVETLEKAERNEVISTDAYRYELKRRGILAPEYDAEADKEKILKQTPKIDFSDPNTTDPDGSEFETPPDQKPEERE